MSFSSEIKERLCRIQTGCPKCTRAELAAVFAIDGDVSGSRVTIRTEHEYIARRIREDILECTGMELSWTGEKVRSFCVDDPHAAENLKGLLLPKYGMAGEEWLDEVAPFGCCRAAYIRGAFLAGGSVSDPSKGYHLEFDAGSRKGARLLAGILENLGFSCKITQRKQHEIVYIKESGVIADVLGAMGAGAGAMQLYNVQIEKEMRNEINRRVNCETANVKKTTLAASRQLQAIQRIQKRMDMTKLPESLQEIARLRMEYPEESLKELGQLLDPPIGKSGVNHRLNRLISIAEELK